MSDPWLKFFTSDWRSDPRLRLCSIAARGLWVEMICLMHEATPYGHLLINGRSPTDVQISALVGAAPDECTALLGELDSAGVFSRTRDGTIYSRKLTRMAKKAAVARNNGRKGGNPNLCNDYNNKPLDNQVDKGGVKPQKPEPEPEPYIKEDTNVSLSLSPPPIDSIAQAVSAYNETADRTGWPKVQKLSPARRSAISGRLKECGGVEGWEFALAKAESSPFLTGQTSKPFCASFDFLTKQSNFTKLMEGNYDPRNSAASQRPGRGSDATERDKALADEILAAARAR